MLLLPRGHGGDGSKWTDSQHELLSLLTKWTNKEASHVEMHNPQPAAVSSPQACWALLLCWEQGTGWPQTLGSPGPTQD